MSTRRALTGDDAVAYGVRLCRVNVIAAYPITPQTPIVEALAKFVADGSLEAEYIESEGEHGVVGAIIGAGLTGVRTFTATSSQGLAFGYENIAWIPGIRLPVVMAIVNRSLAMPVDIWTDYSDSMSVRDHGWMQIYVENNQEALDSIIQAYRIAEDSRVLLPMMVCLDGFYISHTMEMIDVPDQEKIDGFLKPYEQKHIILDPSDPMEMYGVPPSEHGMTFDYLKQKAMENAEVVIKEVNDEFEKIFNRRYGNGLIKAEMTEDAEVALVTMGSMTGDARIAVQNLRNEDKPVGLIRLRTFRPFPREDIQRIAENLKVIAVFDRHLSKGLGEGALFTEVKSTLYNTERRPHLMGFVSGLHGVKVDVSDFEYAAEKALNVANKRVMGKELEWIPKVEWIPPKTTIRPSPLKSEKLIYPGTTACPGCAMVLVFRYALDITGKDVIVIRTAGCQAWASTKPGKTLARVPMGRSVLPGGCSLSTGVSRGLNVKGRDNIPVLLFGGDGSVGDMGFLALSGAAERNENFLCIVYDNEAYANTGIQRSGTTPRYAWTTTTPGGKTRPKKDLPMIVAAHKVPYVATASIAYLEDYKRKLKKGLGMKGFRYIHVYTPCATSWRFPPERTIEMARLGVQTGLWILYEVENGVFKQTFTVRDRKPVKEFIKSQRRFSHLKDEEIELIQKEVDQVWGDISQWRGKRLFLH
ncbi:MAG: hypothetical protein GTN80_08310 [Nitrososphaeria archaeon]|nr:hypothetical protein [Nitrososphaeria archaeon]NIN53038.1 hypothetical protein [Nitrososphaeria archaeon]NIQ33625.1 hypothetical protein [Nitrososphaeria archaeon]